MNTDQAATFLRTVPLFHDISDAELRSIAGSAETRRFRAGEWLVDSQCSSPSLFVFVEGEGQVCVEYGSLGLEVELRRLYPGDYFGIDTVVSGNVPHAVMKATLPGAGLAIAKSTIDELLVSSVALARAFCRALAHELYQVVRDTHGVQFVQLRDFARANTINRLLPPRVSSMCRCLAVEQDGDRVTIAMVNPTDQNTRSFIRHTLRDYRVHFVAITDADFERVGRRILGEIQEIRVGADLAVGISYQDEHGNMRQMGGTHEEDLLHRVLAAAIRSGVSDVHFEPYGSAARARLRLDGRMVSVDEEISTATFRQLLTRIKILSELDTTRIRRPQDGRFMLQVDDRRVEFRVSALPCLGGEKVVLRVIAPHHEMGDLANLMLFRPMEQLARQLFRSPSGLILVTGPSGAGKTTTLYAALNSIVSHDRGINIVTVEDPVEYDLPFATQFQVNRDTGMDFATILRSVLRQDPDVILVGEIRDRESAAMAAEAATTGHLVLSSLHTYSALEAIVRMRDLKVEPYLMAAGLKGVITQQLLPKLAPGCTEPVPSDDPIVARLEDLGVWDGQPKGDVRRGRDQAGGPLGGEQGRVLVGESFVVTPRVAAAIDRAASLSELATSLDPCAHIPIADYARFLLNAGLVAPERILGVLPTEPWQLPQAADSAVHDSNQYFRVDSPNSPAAPTSRVCTIRAHST